MGDVIVLSERLKKNVSVDDLGLGPAFGGMLMREKDADVPSYALNLHSPDLETLRVLLCVDHPSGLIVTDHWTEENEPSLLYIFFSLSREIECHQIQSYPNANTIIVEMYTSDPDDPFGEDEGTDIVAYEWYKGQLREHEVI